MKKQISPKIVSLVFAILVICFAIGFYVLAAWTEPIVAPPGGNVPAPLNTGNIGQGKIGGLIIHTSPEFEDPANPNALLIPYGNVGIGMTEPGTKLEVAGDIRATGFFYSSDLELKKNIEGIEDALEKVQKLKGVSFQWKENNEKSLGLIAQDVEKVFPELVSTDKNTGLKSLEYGKLVAPLIEAIKKQQEQIEELKAKVEKLENNQ